MIVLNYDFSFVDIISPQESQRVRHYEMNVQKQSRYRNNVKTKLNLRPILN